ncbi:MAG: c-type cytochrome [Alphaproteobacteria bacterium]
MLRTTAFFCAAGACLASSVAFAQAEPDNAIKYRQTIYETLGANLTAVVMNLRGEVEFPDAVAAHARTIADTAPLVLPAMEQNTAGEGSAATEARDRIWDNWDDFTSKNRAFEEAAMRLGEAAEGGDMQAIGAEAQAVAETCKSCHDAYRD